MHGTMQYQMTEAQSVAPPTPVRRGGGSEHGERYRDYPLVDATLGSRLVLGFSVPGEPLRRRVPPPLVPSPLPPPAYSAAVGPPAEQLGDGPNLLLVFNDLLLNQDAHEHTQADASARYVGFNIPSRNTVTGEQGMLHFRIFTDNSHAVPGRYRDALPARVRRDLRVIGEGPTTSIHDHWEFQPAPEVGGLIELELTYARAPLTRIVGRQPDFPVWAAADSRIFRVYKEDTLLEVIRIDALGINRVEQTHFRISVPELADLFNGLEQLTFVLGNPIYVRQVYSPPA